MPGIGRSEDATWLLLVSGCPGVFSSDVRRVGLAAWRQADAARRQEDEAAWDWDQEQGELAAGAHALVGLPTGWPFEELIEFVGDRARR